LFPSLDDDARRFDQHAGAAHVREQFDRIVLLERVLLTAIAV
jgi:hypothetical protein